MGEDGTTEEAAAVAVVVAGDPTGLGRASTNAVADGIPTVGLIGIGVLSPKVAVVPEAVVDVVSGDGVGETRGPSCVTEDPAWQEDAITTNPNRRPIPALEVQLFAGYFMNSSMMPVIFT